MKNGGKRKGAGRKPKIDEITQHELFAKAINVIGNKSTPEESQIAFLKKLAESQRGQIWIAEKFWGKPKEVIEHQTDGEASIPILEFFKTSNEDK